MRKLLFRTQWKLFLLLCSFVFSLCAAQALELAKDGKTDYVVVCGDQGNHSELKLLNQTAADFAALLKQSTGADFKVVQPKEAANYSKRIFLGHSKVMKDHLDKLGKYRAVANEDRVMQTIGDDLFLYGGGFGNSYAAYHFLTQEQGFRFWHYWGDSLIPQKKTMTTRDMDEVFRPSFEYRDLAQSSFNLRGMPGAQDYFRRNMLHSNSYMPFSMPGNMTHSYTCLIPPTKNHREAYKFLKDKEYFVTNPEFFPMDENGKRVPRGHRCFSNQGLRDEMNKNVELLLTTSRLTPNHNIVVNISHDDVDCKFCYCKDCVALEAKYGAPGGPLYDYLINSASPYFAKKYPKLIIRFLAYGRLSTEIPPKPESLKDGKLPANLMPYLALLTADFNKPMTAPTNKFLAECFNGWGKISHRMSTYFYPSTYGRPMIQFPLFGNAERVLQDLQFYGKNHVTQVFCDYPSLLRCCNTAFSGLISYGMGRLYENKNADLNAVIDEYMAAMYGKAAPAMRSFYNELHKLAFADKNFVRWFPDPRYVDYLTPEQLFKWQQDFDKMERLVRDDPNARLHVRTERLSVDAMTLLTYRDFRKVGLNNKINAKTVYNRAIATADEIMKRSYSVDLPNHVKKEDKAEYIQWDRDSIYNTLGLFYGMASYVDKLPAEFGPVPEKDRFYVFFSANKMPPVAVEGSPFGYALPAPLPADRLTGYDFVRASGMGSNGRRMEVTTGTSKFEYHYLGRSKLSSTSVMGAPRLKTIISKKFGALNTYATCAMGHIFDAKNPDQEYDIYVNMKFGKEFMYTSHLLLVKVTQNRKPFVRSGMKPQEEPSVSIVGEKPVKLGAFMNALNGNKEENKITATAAFKGNSLLLNITEPVAATPSAKECMEVFVTPNGKYPVFHVTALPDGKVTCQEWSMPVTSNVDGTTPTLLKKTVTIPGKVTSAINDGLWTIQCQLDLPNMPASGGSLVMNIFRTRDGKAPLAWSPIQTPDAYIYGLELFGTIFRDKMVLKGKAQVTTRGKFEGDVAVMNGNDGWSICAHIPRGLNADGLYNVTAIMKTDAVSTDSKQTTRMGVYDNYTKKVIGYRQIPIKDISGKFVPVSTNKAVKIVPGSMIYIGGFIPSKVIQGNVYVEQFVIENAQ